MSDPLHSETKRAALDKALEGQRLLDAKDNDGAICACTRAIESDSHCWLAYSTRAEAYRRLGRRKEARDDLKCLGSVNSRYVFDGTQRGSNSTFVEELIFSVLRGAAVVIAGTIFVQIMER